MAWCQASDKQDEPPHVVPLLPILPRQVVFCVVLCKCEPNWIRQGMLTVNEACGILFAGKLRNLTAKY